MVGLLLFASFGLPADFSQAQSSFADALNSEQIPWRHLSYKVKNFLYKVTTDVRFEIVPAEEAAKLLIPVPQGCAFQTSGSAVFAITVQSVIDPLFGQNDNLKTQSWYNPQEANVLQRIRLRQGEEIWQKTYRFTPNGVWRLRKKPNDSQETKLPLEQWTNSEESFYPYTLSSAECTHIVEPLILLHLVSAIDWESRNGPLSLCVFNKKQLHQVQIHKAGVQRLVVDYRQRLKEGEVRREGEIEAVKYSFKTRSLAAKGKKAEPFSFLGLTGDFDVFVDKTSRIPVQVSGEIARFGKVDIKLREVKP